MPCIPAGCSSIYRHVYSKNDNQAGIAPLDLQSNLGGQIAQQQLVARAGDAVHALTGMENDTGQNSDGREHPKPEEFIA